MAGLILDDRGVIATCANCGQRNRTVFERLGQTGVCGKCKSDLPAPSQPIEIADTAGFDRLAQDSAVPVVVDFWAPWCGPCRMVAPEIAKVAENARGRFVVAKVNTQDLPQLGQRYDIQSIPTMSVFHRGEELARTLGAQKAAGIEVFVMGALANARPDRRTGTS